MSRRIACATFAGSRPTHAHRVRQRDAVGVAHARGLVGLDAIGDRARAPEVRVEAAALLLADRDGLEDARRPAELGHEARDGLDRGDDAERAVECAAATHRVDVRAGDDDAPAARTFHASPDIADGVAPHEQSRFLHPARHELGRGDPRRRIERAVETAARESATLCELVEAPKQAPLVDRHALRGLHDAILVTRRPNRARRFSSTKSPPSKTVTPRTSVRTTAPRNDCPTYGLRPLRACSCSASKVHSRSSATSATSASAPALDRALLRPQPEEPRGRAGDEDARAWRAAGRADERLR